MKVKEAPLAADTTPQSEDKKGIGAPAPDVQTNTSTSVTASTNTNGCTSSLRDEK